MVGRTNANSNLSNSISGIVNVAGEKTYVELGKRPKSVIIYRDDDMTVIWQWHVDMGNKYLYTKYGGYRDLITDPVTFEAHSASPEMIITDTGFGVSYPHYSASNTYQYYAVC